MKSPHFTDAPDLWLSIGLLAFAAFCILVALMPGAHLLKAAVLAWAVL